MLMHRNLKKENGSKVFEAETGKLPYTELCMEILPFEEEDIVTASNGQQDQGEIDITIPTNP